ncbi:MAG: alkaline phosphatase family protein [Leptospiraceae bacterium]|nr:alkaline phosphatase family protein [Leptospiraceae bacterium]
MAQKLFSFLLVYAILNCKPIYDSKIIKNSFREDIQFILVPKKFNILESDWVFGRTDSHFDKKELIKYLKNYGRTIDDLKKIPNINYREVDEEVILNIAKTSHSTGYDYDANIPISFYGKEWFKEGEYSDKIEQQNIVPTLTKILKHRLPNGVTASSVNKILKETTIKPEIIVTVVIDQGGQQAYNAHPNSFPNIAKLRKESAYFPNARVGHLDAHTAVGHMAIGTGSYPSASSVIGNTFFKLEKGKITGAEIYAVDETKVNTEELAVETLADVLDSENADKSEVISQCYALRASIGMAGHGAFKQKKVSYQGDRDFVYWLNKKDGTWITDQRYYSLPYASYSYNSYRTFKESYPNGWLSHNASTEEELKKFWSVIMATPAQTKMEGELFRKAIQNHIIDAGKKLDGNTDLAYVTFKALDASGHSFGFESIESTETLKEIDNQVGLLLEMLTKEYGDKFIFILTADHGCAPLPEITGGKRLDLKSVFTKVNELIPKDTDESLIKFMTVGQIGLNLETMKKYSLKESDIRKKILEIEVDGENFFQDVLRSKDYQ